MTKEHFRLDLAGRIREGLAACNSRMDIAQAMGYQDPSTLSRWANGGTMPTAENLAALGDATGLSVDWLIVGRGPMFASSVSDPLRLQAISRIVNGDVTEDVLRALARPRTNDTRESLLTRMQEIVATLIDTGDEEATGPDLVEYKKQGT